MFIGQGAGSRKGGGGGGMAQREQKAVLAEFRRGAFNTLVATCIGEEGLDIPQVPPVCLHAWLLPACHLPLLHIDTTPVSRAASAHQLDSQPSRAFGATAPVRPLG